MYASNAPSASTLASLGLGTACAVILAWVFKQFFAVDVPGEVQAALGSIISAFTGYFFAGGRREDVV